MKADNYSRFRNSVTSELRNVKKTYYDKLLLYVRNDVKKTYNIGLCHNEGHAEVSPLRSVPIKKRL